MDEAPITLRLPSGAVVTLRREHARAIAARLWEATSVRGSASLAAMLAQELRHDLSVRGPLQLDEHQEAAFRAADV